VPFGRTLSRLTRVKADPIDHSMERETQMSRSKCLILAAVCITAVLIAGCGKDDGDNQAQSTGPAQQQSSQPSVPQAPAQPQASAQPPSSGGMGGIPSPGQLSEMAAKNREVLTQMNQGKAVAAVTASTLKTVLPEKLAGMNRTDASAERNQAMGIDVTTAHAQYEGQNDMSLNLTVTDAGNMTGPMRMGLAAWAMAEYSRETDTGYEKTGTFNGYKGMEEYDTENKQGSIRVFVADRFVVELDGYGLTMDTLKQALGQLDLKKIAALASGVQ